MNVTIEKITNGFIVTIDGKKTFCDVPEAICGLTSEAVLAECLRLESKPAADAAIKSQLASALQQMQSQGLIRDAGHFADAFKYASSIGPGESFEIPAVKIKVE